MNRFFKTAMLWLLALALPVQGFAAITQSSCAPQMQTHHLAAASDGIPDSLQSHHQITTDGIDHALHQTNLQADHTAHIAASAPTDQQTNLHANVKCSVCATCYIGLAMLPVLPQVPACPIASTPVVSSLSSLFPGHIPDGLKRPPKFSLV